MSSDKSKIESQTTWGQTPYLTVVYPGEDEREIEIDRYILLNRNFAPKKILACYFNGSRQPSYPHIKLTGKDSNDLLLQMAFLWDKDVLYLNARITDDVQAKDDSLSVNLETDGKMVQLEGNSEDKFTLFVNGEEKSNRFSIRFSRREDNASLSAFIPWESIGLKLSPGSLIDVKVKKTDSDDGQATEVLEWKGKVLVITDWYYR